MTTTKAPVAPTPAPIPAAASPTPSKITAALKWLCSWSLAIIFSPFKALWATLKATGRVTIWGFTLTKTALVTYGIDLAVVVLSLAIGAGGAHIYALHHPQIVNSAGIRTVTVPVVDAKTSAQISMLSSQIEGLRQMLIKQPANAVMIPAPVVLPAADPATPQPVAAPVPPALKHRAAPKKAAASGWFQ